MFGSSTPGVYVQVPVLPIAVKLNSVPSMLGNRAELISGVEKTLPETSNLIMTGELLGSYFVGTLQFANPIPNTPEQSLPLIVVIRSAFAVVEKIIRLLIMTVIKHFIVFMSTPSFILFYFIALYLMYPYNK